MNHRVWRNCHELLLHDSNYLQWTLLHVTGHNSRPAALSWVKSGWISCRESSDVTCVWFGRCGLIVTFCLHYIHTSNTFDVQRRGFRWCSEYFSQTRPTKSHGRTIVRVIAVPQILLPFVPKWPPLNASVLTAFGRTFWRTWVSCWTAVVKSESRELIF